MMYKFISCEGTNWTYEILSILTSGKLQPAKVPLTQTAIEMKKTFERTENEAVPMVFPTHLKFDLMPKDVLGKVCIYHIKLTAQIYQRF